MNQHQAMQALLEKIEQEMRNQQLWARTKPSEQALASREPFCVDTLSFCEWVQWIMIPRLNYMAEQRLPLPSNSEILPMAEEAFKLLREETDALERMIAELDTLMRTPH